jgi:membrane dipeptidase
LLSHWQNRKNTYNIEFSVGRIETRGYYVQDASELAKQFPKWKGLNPFGKELVQ